MTCRFTLSAMKFSRRAAASALALVVSGCAFGSGGLLTGDGNLGGACFTSAARGVLVSDAKAGTAIIDEDSGGGRSPVMWRDGFSARHVGSEVAVLDPSGNVVATTGTRYRLVGGYTNDAFYACGEVTRAP